MPAPLNYGLADFTENPVGNLFGGLTAAVVALPLALAFGIASGLGPAAGLTGAIAVGLFAALFGGTRQQISGPTGPMTVVVASTSVEILSTNPEGGLAMVFATIVLAGFLQMLFGFLKFGRYFIMVPYPVISGFMSGIGIIIIILQLGPLLGFDGSSTILDAARALPDQVANLKTASLALGLSAFIFLLAWPGYLNRLLPAPIVVLVVGSLVAYLIPDAQLNTIGNIPSLLPSLQLPVIQWSSFEVVLKGALMLALLGSIDSLLTSLVAENVTGVPHESDRELIGQGIGNVASGLLGGLPGAGATMRTVVNIQAGGTGPASGILHAVFLAVTAFGLAGLFENIPLTVLAAILIKVGIDIIDLPFIRRALQLPPFATGLMLTVMLLTIFVNLIVAVIVGMFVKNLVTLDKLSNLQLGNLKITDGESDSSEEPPAVEQFLRNHSISLVKIDGPLSYSVARGLSERFRNLQDSEHLVVDLTQAEFVGVTSALAIEDLIRAALIRDCEVWLIDQRMLAHRELAQVGVMSLVPEDHFFPAFTEFMNSFQVPEKENGDSLLNS